MKAHDVAKALTHIARVLRAGPNVELGEIGNLETHATTNRAPSKKEGTGEKGAALAVLAELSQFKKNELIELIEALGLNVEVKTTDSVRDLLGRTLKHIADNPSVKQNLASANRSQGQSSSSTLSRALAILLEQS